jgi:hypothetical protein
MSTTLTIQNPTRSRRWGFGYCTSPTGDGPYSIEVPNRPEHTGTIRQVREAIASDRTYRSFVSGGVFFTRQWFFDGQPVMRDDVEQFLNTLDCAAAFHEQPPRTVTLRLTHAVEESPR